MKQESHTLGSLLCSLFTPSELRQFVKSLDDGDDLMTHFPSNALSSSDMSMEVASLLERWGIADADLLLELYRWRPNRERDILFFYRQRARAHSTQAVSLELVASINEAAVGIYRLHPGQIKLIGRSEDSDIQLPLNLVKISRYHAWISWPGTGPMIQDLGSKNGTWVNGRRVSRSPLRQGFVVDLGELKIIIQEPNRTETAVQRSEDTLS